MQIRGYEMLGKIGEGPCGTVWKARQLSMDRLVALKVMNPAYAQDAAAMARFNSDGLRAAKLMHHNLVVIHDRGDVGGAPYVASEFVDGEVLAALMARKGRLPEQQALAVAESVAHALKYAWDRGQIIHGAIKPGNIIADRDGVVKVVDLGSSRVLRRDKEHPVEVAAGPANYVSPEQASGEALLDYRADIYSLGAVLYHMVTGVLPFVGPGPAEIMDRHLSGFLTDPREINPQLSAPLAALLEKMMMRKRSDRYASWSEVIEDMELVVHEKMPQPPLAEPGQSVVSRSVTRNAPATPAATPSAVPEAPVGPSSLDSAAPTSPAPETEPPRNSSLGLIVGVAIAAGLVVAGYWAANQRFSPDQPTVWEQILAKFAPAQTEEPSENNATHEPAETTKTGGESQPDKTGEETKTIHTPQENAEETAKSPSAGRNKEFDENPLWAELVAYIGFDESNGAHKVVDASGNGHDGLFRDGVNLGLAGQIGKAADFDRASSGRILLSGALNLDANTATFALWVKGRATKSPRSGLLFWNGETASSGIFLNGRNELRYTWNSDDETSDWNSGFTLPDDVWTFVALVVEPAKATFYMGPAGQPLQSSVNKTPHAPCAFNTPLVLGNDAKTDRYFDGRLDEIAIWKRSLAQPEIEALFRAESNGARPKPVAAAEPAQTETPAPAPAPRPAVVPAPNIPPVTHPTAPAPTPKPKPAAWHDADYERAVGLYNNCVTTYQKYLTTRDNQATLRKIIADLDTAVALLEKVKKTAPPGKDIQRVIDLCNKLTFDVHGTMQISN